VRIEDYADTLRGHRVLHLIGKGNNPATMPLTVPVLRVPEASREQRTCGPLVLRPVSGQPIDRRDAYPMVARIAKAAGIPRHSVNPIPAPKAGAGASRHRRGAKRGCRARKFLGFGCRARGPFRAYRDMSTPVEPHQWMISQLVDREASRLHSSTNLDEELCPLLGVEDVAQILGLTTETLQSWHANRTSDGPRASLIRGELRFTLSEVGRYMRGHPRCAP